MKASGFCRVLCPHCLWKPSGFQIKIIMLHQTFQEQERAPVEGRQRSTPRLLLLRPAAYGSSHRCSQAGFLGVIPTIPISSALYFLHHRLNSFSLEGAHDFNNFSFYYSHQRSSNSFGLISGVLAETQTRISASTLSLFSWSTSEKGYCWKWKHSYTLFLVKILQWLLVNFQIKSLVQFLESHRLYY